MSTAARTLQESPMSSDVQRPRASDKVAGTILGPDGAPASRPTVVLSPDEAALVRSYMWMMISAGYDPSFGCIQCLPVGPRGYRIDPEVMATYLIDEAQIVITCACRQVFHQGHTTSAKFVKTVLLEKGVSGVPGMQMTAAITSAGALLLRSWTKFLRKHRYMEALRCTPCFEMTQSDGCQARVTDTEIFLRCRCRMAQYTEGTC